MNKERKNQLARARAQLATNCRKHGIIKIPLGHLIEVFANEGFENWCICNAIDFEIHGAVIHISPSDQEPRELEDDYDPEEL